MFDVKWIYKIGLTLIFLSVQYCYGSILYIHNHKHNLSDNIHHHHHHHHHHSHIHKGHHLSYLSHCHLYHNHLPACVDTCRDLVMERQSNGSQKNKEKIACYLHVFSEINVRYLHKLPLSQLENYAITSTCYDQILSRGPPAI